MRPQAYLDHIHRIETSEGIAPQTRQALLDSAKREFVMALPEATQRIVFAFRLLRNQECPRDLIPARLCAAYGVGKSQAYRDLTAALALFPRNGNDGTDNGS